MPERLVAGSVDVDGAQTGARGRGRPAQRGGQQANTPIPGGGGDDAADVRATSRLGESLVLHELKIISCNKTRYRPGWKERAVDRRADALQQEYLDKARKADRQYNGVLAGVVGPVEQRLLGLGEVRGVVAGNFGEVSGATHLLAHLATCQVRGAEQTRGRRWVMRV